MDHFEIRTPPVIPLTLPTLISQTTLVIYRSLIYKLGTISVIVEELKIKAPSLHSYTDLPSFHSETVSSREGHRVSFSLRHIVS